MSPPISHHPQTSRQAKKNYLRKQANPVLSECELRRLKRDVELHERANRIKSKEQRRKANLKKKEEKMEKEREARRKAGLPEVREKYVSPRQQRLGAFVGLGKRTREEDNAAGNQIQPEARSPLQSKSPNTVLKPHPCGVPSAAQVRSKIDVGCIDVRVNDTQFAKELLPAVTKIPTMHQPASLNVGKSLTVQVDRTTELLELISTQDLQSSDEDSSVTLEAEEDNGDGQSDFSDADFEELAQVLDCGPVLCLKPDLKQNIPPAHLDDNPIRTSKEDDTLFDEFAPSSQDLLDLIDTNDFDEFEMSTQDIRNLDP